MLLSKPTPEQIAAREKRNALALEQLVAKEDGYYRAALVILGGVILLAITTALLMQAAAVQLIPVWLSNALTTVLFLGWLAYIFLRLKPGYPSASLADIDEDYLRKNIDFRQRHSRISLRVLLWNLIYMSFIFTVIISKKHPQGILPTLFAGVLVLLAFIFVLALLCRPGDELSRAQRAQAAQFGYVLAVLEMCALLAATAYRPQWGYDAMPLAIAAAIALPGFYFLHLESRSDRG